MTIGTILKDLFGPKARLVIYLVIALGVLTWGAWQAADGDWLLFIGSLFVALQGAMSASNINLPEE